MLYPRIIPCLLVKNKGLVKSTKFTDFKYVGDPLNAVKIFNEKEVDELIVLDIDASAEKREPDYKMIENLAMECRMPLCYGGGIKNVEQANRIFSLGVEKIGISSVALENPEIIKKIANRVGNQSVVVIMDIKKKRFGSKYEIYTHNGTTNTGQDPNEFVKKAEVLGAGEIVINFIDHDGMMQGFDLATINTIREKTNLPITVMGGAGQLADIKQLIGNFGIIGAAAGSLFVFKGIYRAVLINYPSPTEKEKLISEALNQFYISN